MEINNQAELYINVYVFIKCKQFLSNIFYFYNNDMNLIIKYALK